MIYSGSERVESPLSATNVLSISKISPSGRWGLFF